MFDFLLVFNKWKIEKNDRKEEILVVDLGSLVLREKNRIREKDLVWNEKCNRKSYKFIGYEFILRWINDWLSSK